MGNSWKEIWGLPNKVEEEVQVENEEWIPRNQADRDKAAQALIRTLVDAEKQLDKQPAVLREVRTFFVELITRIDETESVPIKVYHHAGNEG